MLTAKAKQGEAGAVDFGRRVASITTRMKSAKSRFGRSIGLVMTLGSARLLTGLSRACWDSHSGKRNVLGHCTPESIMMARATTFQIFDFGCVSGYPVFKVLSWTQSLTSI